MDLRFLPPVKMAEAVLKQADLDLKLCLETLKRPHSHWKLFKFP